MFKMLYEMKNVRPNRVLSQVPILVRNTVPALLLLAVVAGLPGSALAGGWNGQQSGTLTGSAIFTIIGDKITFEQGAASTYLTIAGKVSNQQLLGINSVWIVSNDGNTLQDSNGNPLVASYSTGSKITGSNSPTSWDYVSGPTGYTTNSGWGSKDPWLQLASDADVYAGSGKNPAGYSKGEFTFTGLSSLNYQNYKIGIDYLVASPGDLKIVDGKIVPTGPGETGRVYVNAVSRTSSAVPTPELSTVTSLGLILGLGFMGMILRRPRPKNC